VLVGEFGVVTFGAHHEFAGNGPGALVDELIEGVLAVRARLAPDDGA
jgi:hypothetical protein